MITIASFMSRPYMSYNPTSKRSEIQAKLQYSLPENRGRGGGAEEKRRKKTGQSKRLSKPYYNQCKLVKLTGMSSRDEHKDNNILA